VAEITSSPDTKVIWDDHGLENNVVYYYALRAIDKAGNASGLTGDGGTVTYEETVSTPAEAEAETVAVAEGAVATAKEEGAVLAEEEVEEAEKEIAPEEAEKGLIQGAVQVAKKSPWPWLILGGLVVIGLGYWLSKKEEK